MSSTIPTTLDDLLIGDTITIQTPDGDRQAFVISKGYETITLHDPITGENSVAERRTPGHAPIRCHRLAHEEEWTNRLEPGEYVSDREGRYMTVRIIDLAEELGFRHAGHDMIERYDEGESDGDDLDILVELADHAADWLNERLPLDHHYWDTSEYTGFGLWLRGTDSQDDYGLELASDIRRAEQRVAQAITARAEWVSLAVEAGMTYRDIGEALNISHQRVAQLLHPRPKTCDHGIAMTERCLRCVPEPKDDDGTYPCGCEHWTHPGCDRWPPVD